MEHGGQVREPVLMGKLRGTRRKTKDDECKNSSTLKKKTDEKIIKV